MTTAQDPARVAPLYRERLWPTPWIFLATALVIPASLLVFLPISVPAGIVSAIVLYTGCVVLLIVASPTVAVTAEEFQAGRARLPLRYAGEATAHYGTDATLERGRLLDARAWLVIRGWVSPVVKVTLTDPTDPAPYWLVSTRRPQRVIEAIARGREVLPAT